MNKIRSKALFAFFVLLLVVYLILNLVLPVTNTTYIDKYHLSSVAVEVLRLSVVIPFAAIWFLGFFGYDRVRIYADTVRKSKDGEGMNMVAKGLMWLSLYLPLSAVLSSALDYIDRQHHSSYAAWTIVYNYIFLAVLMLGIGTLLYGSDLLVGTIKRRPYGVKEQVLILLFIIISGMYTYLTLTNPARQTPTAAGGHAAYYMPDIPLLLTIVLPTIFIWYAGIKTAYNIQVYCSNVSGVLYKKALNYLAYGIGLTVTGIMSIRYLVTMTSFLSATAPLHAILALIYMFLLVVGFSFGLIAVGARRLQKIEEA